MLFLFYDKVMDNREIAKNNLPVQALLPELKAILSEKNHAVLTAPPGAGKTTAVPLALLAEAWLNSQKILLLEPRRLAVKAAAGYMAKLLGEETGDTVGYRVRGESRVGPRTRLEVITEGILIRMLQKDAALEGVGAILFDEFHERSLQSDLGLALTLQTQELLRPDLRLVIMSATLETKRVAALLSEAPILISEGKLYPVTVHYRAKASRERVETAVIRVLQEALSTTNGDILVFLPGIREIRYVAAELTRSLPMADYAVVILHGSLTLREQGKAIHPEEQYGRRIILSTSIAETSLTVEGVGVVVDSGLMRVARFSPRTGMTHLETVTVSAASAEQRRGRAGRTRPGVCFRLWSEAENSRLAWGSVPEILQADLAGLALELAVWGIDKPEDLNWLDVPPAAAFAQARGLLQQLGALEGERVTGHGRKMAQAGVHPRLSHMILKGKEYGAGAWACELAAILNARETLASGRQDGNADIINRINGFSAEALSGIQREAQLLRREFGITGNDVAGMRAAYTGILLAFAYPDRIAQRREDGRYLLRNGRGAAFSAEQALSQEAYLAAAELDDHGADCRILLAAPLTLGDLMKYWADQIVTEESVYWDRRVQGVRAKRQERLGSLVLKEGIGEQPDKGQLTQVLLQGIREEGLDILSWTRAAEQFVRRLRFMSSLEEGWPDMSEEHLLATLEEWLAPYVTSITGREGLRELNLLPVLETGLDWKRRQRLEEEAPTHITVPSGQRHPIDYSQPEAPCLSVRLQEMFGLQDTPLIGGGRIPLLIHLLSPAGRPVQVTRDLAGFWRQAYFEVRKELAGRYPKHYWPEDPLIATATHRAKPKNK